MSHDYLSAADREAVQARIDDTWAALSADPDNPDKALRALGAHARLHDVAGFRKLAEFLEPRAEAHPGILAGLIYIHRELREIGVVARLFERAERARPGDDEWHEGFARLVMDYGYREEAWPHLQHIVQKGIPDKVGLLLGLAQMHQAVGEHPAALRYFASSETIDPRLSDAEEFQALVQASRAAGGQKTRVNSGQVLVQLRQRKQLGRAMRVMPALLALIVVAYAAVAGVRAYRRTVWLVNGLSEAYRVSVGGALVELPPGQPTEVVVAEGPLEVRADGAATALGTQNVTLTTPFWSRPWSHPVFVINPDRCAVLGRLHVEYTKYQHTADPRCDWSAGRLFEEFLDVDDPFRAPPDRITVSEGGRTVRVVLMQGSLVRAGQRNQLAALRQAIGNQEYLALLARWLKLAPAEAHTSGTLRSAATPAEVVALLEPGLDARPVELDRHRSYQDAMEDAGRGPEAARRYAELKAREPDDSALAYLAARAQEDPDVWLSVLERLSRDPAAPKMARRSHVGALMQRARFDEAIEGARKLAEGPPPDAEGEMYLWIAMNYAGRFSEALERMRQDKLTDPTQRTVERCLTLAAIGREKEGRELIRSRLGELTFEQSEALMTHVDALMAAAAGRDEEAGAALLKSHDPREKALGALLMKSPANAAKALGEKVDPFHALAIFLTYHQQNKPGEPGAQEALRLAIAGLKTGHGAGGRAAAAVLGGGTMPAERLVKLYIPLETKALVLAVLGVLRPADRAIYFDMARKMNRRGHYPFYLVKAVVGD